MRRRARASTIAAAALGWTLVPCGAVEASGTDRGPQVLAAYAAVLERYAGGDLRGALAEIGQWPANDFDLVAQRIRAARRVGAAEWDDRAVARAISLHTDAAFAGLAQARHALVELHLDLASRLLDLLGDRGWRRRFEARWSLAVACRQWAAGQFESARDSVRRARERDPKDWAPPLVDGTFAEEVGTPSMLVVAARAYRDALERLPGNPSIQLRLGRVLARRKSYEAALAELRRAQESRDPAISSLAHLFIGQIGEGRGELAAAVEAYRNALALQPGRQTPLIALSRALWKTGLRVESRRLLQPLLEGTAANEDPWWGYQVGPSVCQPRQWEADKAELPR